MECMYCNKQCISKNSLTNHQLRCPQNPNKIKSGFTDYNKTNIAKDLRDNNNNQRKGKTNEEVFGKEKANAISSKISIKGTNKKHTQFSKDKMSKAMMGNRNANHRGDRQSYYNGIRMDSSWEVRTAKYLDKHKYNWKYSSERYLLSTGQYIHPDFFVYNINGSIEKIIEVKGYFREANKIKFELFKKEYPNLIIELWNKDVLRAKQIID